MREAVAANGSNERDSVSRTVTILYIPPLSGGLGISNKAGEDPCERHLLRASAIGRIRFPERVTVLYITPLMRARIHARRNCVEGHQLPGFGFQNG